jgi:DNA-binding LacI/PurR family transcriptional regulator
MTLVSEREHVTSQRPVPGAPRKVTIYDVARAAGVGKQTVSNVLNGSGRVGAAARERVLEIVAELGYHPHQGARSLRSRRTMQLGYLMPEMQLQLSNLIMMQFLHSLVAAGASENYRVVVVAQHDDPCEGIRRLVASRSVDGFVLSDLQPGDGRVALLRDLAVPFACFGRTGQGMPQHWVDIDNCAAEASAVRHVVEQGFTRLGYVGYASGDYRSIERQSGFRAGLASVGMTGTEAGLLRLDATAGAHAQIQSFLASARPDAILAGSDKIAANVYSVAAELRLRVGRDLAVTGFDGSIGADLLHPRLTTIQIPVEEIARSVIGRLLRQIDGEPDAGPGEILSATLRPAESTSARPARTGFAVLGGNRDGYEPKVERGRGDLYVQPPADSVAPRGAPGGLLRVLHCRFPPCGS